MVGINVTSISDMKVEADQKIVSSFDTGIVFND
jgi:hypothetical protein